MDRLGLVYDVSVETTVSVNLSANFLCQSWVLRTFLVCVSSVPSEFTTFPDVPVPSCPDPEILHLDLLGRIRSFVGKFLHHPLVLAQICIHSCHQLRRVKRLGDVVVRPKTQPPDLVY